MIDPAPSNPAATRHAARGVLPPAAALAAALALAVVGSGLPRPQRAVPALSAPRQATLPAAADAVEPDAGPVAAAIDPEPTDGAGREAPVGPPSRWAWTSEPPMPAPDAGAEAVPEAQPIPGAVPDVSAAEPPRAAMTVPMTVPLPVPRPPELRGLAEGARRAQRLARRQPAPPPPSPAEDDRSFLEKLFGVERAPALSYAALESRPADLAPRARLSPPLSPPAGEGGTAVYDITARTVTLPGGERLEAHSGLAELMDDPRQVNVRMRGATPPGTYALSEREQPFHGVRAIRLTPVGGPEAVYGRVGLLAHTYMLGPTGASNGCVSFRDYDRFLQAYLEGRIQRLVVVPGTQDALPTLAGSAAVPVRLARN